MLNSQPLMAEISWLVRGRSLRPHCNYWVYAGLCESGIFVHADPTCKLLWPRDGRITVRLSASRVTELRNFEAILRFGSDWVLLIEPEVRSIRPAVRIYSPLVQIKNVDCDQDCRKAIAERLEVMGVRCGIQVLQRGVVVVKHARLSGYGVTLTELCEMDSILVQSVGIGGKNAMGCGVFEPC